MAAEPARDTLIALRATRACHRLAADVAAGRMTRLATVHCVSCGRPIAVATDAAHPAARYEGRVVCRICRRARRVAKSFPPDALTLEYEIPSERLEELYYDGWTTQGDPRPTLWQWLRGMFSNEKRTGA